MASARVILKPRKARPFYHRHPWVLDTAVDKIDGQPADGDIVDLLTDGEKFIARGFYNSQSRIRVRLYSWEVDQPLDEAFFGKRIAAACGLRAQLGYFDRQGAARLVYSEADGLSGLIADRFADYLCVQVTSLGMANRLDMLIPILARETGVRGILLRTEKGAPQSEGIELHDQLLWGSAPEGPIFIDEHGVRYGVDLVEGQKTGFYLDQRENRLAAARYFSGKRVLDMFCYSGGFSLNALVHGRAREVWAFDSSPKAVALAKANAELNGQTTLRVEAGEGFETLAALAQQGERFDAVILDPPKFTRSRKGVDEALRAYHRLNRLGVELLTPGGILVTCSCSGHVVREDFLDMLVGVAQQTRRDIQILEQRGASPDHPISAACLETEYLKCFICRVV
jgi:23S rRNA (cytosine1962-C5)-methyltransferase